MSQVDGPGRAKLYPVVGERRRAQGERRAGDASARGLFELSPDPAWIIEGDRFVAANAAALAAVGYEGRPESLSLHPAEVSPEFQPDGESSQRAIAQHVRIARERGVHRFEWAYCRRDGTPFLVEVTLAAMDLRGRQILYCIWRDISERKRTEQRLRLEHAVAACIAGADDASAALKEIIRAVCETEGWGRGSYWHVDQAAGVLRFHESWDEPTPALERYAQASRAFTYRRGEGLVGRVWESGEPLWLADAVADERVLQKTLIVETGLRSMFVFPVVAAEKVIGVLAFFSRDQRRPDERLLASARMIGSQAGQFLQRKQAEEALRESEARYRALTELSTDWYWEQDENLRFTYLSRPNVGQPEIPVDTFVGRTRREAPGVHWDPADLAALEAIMDARLPFRDFELGRSYLNGPKHYVQMSGEPKFDASGRFTGYRGVGKNVTERRRRDEGLRIFRAAMNATADGIYITDRAGMRFIDVNDSACRMQGRTREELMALGPEGAIGIPRAELERTYDAFIASGAEAQRFELLRKRANGGEAWVEVERSARRWGGRWVIVTVVRDITERRRSEQARVELEGQLRESQKLEAIGTLAGGIAHDFNNILSAIIGNAALARQDVGTSHPALESLDEIKKASVRGKDMVQQILAFSRRQPREPVLLPLHMVVEEAVKLLRVTLPAGVVITTAMPKAPLHVLGDATQLQQILMNLCTNAWQALDGRGGRIGIQMEEVVLDAAESRRLGALQPGSYAHLRVADKGKGMDAATLARVFEPFFTTKPVGQGTGLGMAVVHGIVKAHEGAIVVDSAPGAGTTVDLYLPAKAAPPVAAEAPAPSQDARGRGERVLYIDDDESMVFLVTRLLNRLGYRTTGYVWAEDAVDAVRADPRAFDLIVTDYNMPGLSGLDVARELGAIRRDLPIVITSGYITEELQSESARLGVRELVCKPNSVDELCGVIHGLLAAGE